MELFLLFIHSVMSNSLWPHRLQHARLPCPSPAPGACSNMSIESVMPSNHLILCRPLLFLPSIFPSIRVFSRRQVSSSHQVAKVLELQYQFFQWIFRADFLLNWLVWSPCSPRDSQQSSPTPHFKNINSSVLSFWQPTPVLLPGKSHGGRSLVGCSPWGC